LTNRGELQTSQIYKRVRQYGLKLVRQTREKEALWITRPKSPIVAGLREGLGNIYEYWRRMTRKVVRRVQQMRMTTEIKGE
jgi:hypothetical protein